MNNEIAKVFAFEGTKIRVVHHKGELWFVATDVCRILEIQNTSDATKRLDNDESTLVSIEGEEAGGICSTYTGGVVSNYTLINTLPLLVISEAGLYSLVLGSRKPQAKAFKRWVTHEVLPAIRKTGLYSVQAAPALPQDYEEALAALLEKERERKRVADEADRLALEASKNAPMVEFYHTVASSPDTISLEAAAKLLGWGRNRMMAECRLLGILNDRNLPYQKLIDRKLFRVVERAWTDSNGQTHVAFVTQVYQRGLEFLRRRLAAWKEVA